MSINSLGVTLWCDGCENIYTMDPHETAKAARDDARSDGWHRNATGDYCDECWAAGIRTPKV